MLNDQTQTWTSFNLPSTLKSSASVQASFSYGPDHQRWKQAANESSGTEVTHYVGGLLEKVASAGVTKWRHYVPTPSGHMVLVSRNSNATGATTYVVTDHLGSSDTLLDHTGAAKAKLSFDAFGARRGSDWTTTTAPDWTNIAATTRRGFTFHTQLDAVSLVHMNGRVFDPKLGQFMSVDPIIGDLADSQSVNPYAYVGNRALSFTDPTGFEPLCLSTVCGTIVASVVNTALNFIFGGSSAPPPPPAISLPGQSAQNGTALCGPGSSSMPCGGPILYANSPPAAEGALYQAGRTIVIDVIISYIPVAGTAKGIYDAYLVFSDPTSGTIERVIAVVGVIPGGKTVGAPAKAIFRVVESSGRAGKAASAVRATDVAAETAAKNVGDIRAAGAKDAHHVIQDAAVRDLPGYDSASAPGVHLPGPSTRAGTPHHAATQVQRQPGGGTYGAERRIAYKALRRAGMSDAEARRAVEQADEYFEAIGVTRTTPTRIPGNRN